MLHFATVCDAGLNLGQKHILAALKTPNFSRARLRRALEEGLFSFWAGEAVKNKSSCVRHFGTFSRYRAKFMSKTHTRSLKNAKIFSHAPSARAAGCLFTFLAVGAAKNKSFLCAFFCHILQLQSVNLAKKTYPPPQKRQISRGLLPRVLVACIFMFYAQGRCQKQALLVCVILRYITEFRPRTHTHSL